MLRHKDSYTVTKLGHDYDPFEFRDYTLAVSNWGIIMHIVKSAVGAGMLSMPRAFWGTGWLEGLLLTACLGLICTWCLYGLVETAREQCIRSKQPMLDYGDTVRLTLLNGPKWLHKYANPAKYVLNTILLMLYIGVCTVYVMAIATQTKQLYECQTSEMDKNTDISFSVYVAILAAIFIGALQFRDLRKIAPLSALANFAYLVVVMTVLYFVFKSPLPDLSTLPKFRSLDTLPMAASIIVLSIENVGSILPLENNMKTPQDYLGIFGVLPLSMAGIVFLYSMMGFLPYWRYGDETAVVISLNLDQRDVSAVVVKSLVVITIIVSYTLNGFVATDLLARLTKGWIENYTVDAKMRTILKTSVRVVLSLLTVILAMVIPNLGGVMGLTSALFNSSLGIGIPVLLELITFWNQGKHYMLRRMKCFAFLAVYILILVFGVFDAIRAMMGDSPKEHCPVKAEPVPTNISRRAMFRIFDL